MKPYLLIDIDGVLNPDFKSANHNTYRIEGYSVYLNPEHGKKLLSLSDRFELAWATTWQELANVYIAPKLGLPELPYVLWSMEYPTTREWPNRVMGKTYDIHTWVDGRSFAWIDDDINRFDIEHLKNLNLPQKWLAHHINPYDGITDDDFDILEKWVQDVN